MTASHLCSLSWLNILQVLRSIGLRSLSTTISLYLVTKAQVFPTHSTYTLCTNFAASWPSLSSGRCQGAIKVSSLLMHQLTSATSHVFCASALALPMCFVLQLCHFPCVLCFSFGTSHVFCASALALPMCFVLQLWHFPCVLSFSFGTSHVFCASALALPMCFELQLWLFPCVLCFSFGTSHVF